MRIKLQCTFPPRFKGNVLPSMREWLDRHSPPIVAKPPKPAEEPKKRTPATPLEKMAIEATRGITFCVGSPDKRFVRNICLETSITDAQRGYLWRIIWRYRRQIVNKDLVEIAKAKIEEAA